MSEQSLMWGGFGLLMVIMLAIDLGMNRKAHEVSLDFAAGDLYLPGPGGHRIIALRMKAG